MTARVTPGKRAAQHRGPRAPEPQTPVAPKRPLLEVARAALPAELAAQVDGWAERTKSKIEAVQVYRDFLKAAERVKDFVAGRPGEQGKLLDHLREIAAQHFPPRPDFHRAFEPWAESTRTALVWEFEHHPAWASTITLREWACLSLLAGHRPSAVPRDAAPSTVIKREKDAMRQAIDTVETACNRWNVEEDQMRAAWERGEL